MLQKLRELISADPFQPFVVALADGRHLDVTSPDLLWTPAGVPEGFHFFDPLQDQISSISPGLIASVIWPVGAAAGDQE